MRRAYCVAWLAGLLATAGMLAYHTRADGKRPDPPTRGNEKPAALPLTQVALFDSGVGYFQREGTVEGDARVDLAFPAEGINDVLKSLVLQDPGQGSVTEVSYDSHEPVERTLNSFALDLTGNPTFGQILNQARGEHVEVTLLDGGVSTTVSGRVVGMESQPDSGGKEVHLLNLLAADGLHSVQLGRVQRVHFVNATLDAELSGALRVLAAAHDTKKKLVHLHFKGKGKRGVRVGYVAECPMWKMTYRLTFDDDGKPTLQARAVVENTTDEDWNEVRVALVSGRPLSFVMDLYQPLFVPRPKVEPELYASLRPPAYSGALVSGTQLGALGALGAVGGLGAFGLPGAVGGAVGGLPGNLQGTANMGGANGTVGFGGGQLGQGWYPALNRYQPGGFQGGAARGPVSLDEDDAPLPGQQTGRRLTYEELLQRRQKAREEKSLPGGELAAVDPKASLADETGATGRVNFRHVVQDKLTLGRQKSALVPILDGEVQGKRVSVFNEAVHPRTPLVGLKFKNTTGKPLPQGPLTVYEAGGYSGDARVLALQPNEERLLAFALDQAVEVQTSSRQSTGPRLLLRRLNEELRVHYTLRKTQTYLLRNRSGTDRLMVIEHPSGSGWSLVTDNKPAERTRDHYRFEVQVRSDKTTKFEVAEEQPFSDPFNEPDQAFKDGDRLVQHYTTKNPGIEFDLTSRPVAVHLTGLKIAGGRVTVSYRKLEDLTYRVRNVSQSERLVTVEHQTRAGHSLVGDAKPVSGSTDRYHFLLTVAPGQVAEQTLQESSRPSHAFRLSELDEEQAHTLLASAAVSEPAKAVLSETLKRRSEMDTLRKSVDGARTALRGIVDGQARLRANLERLPAASAAYKRYLEKFDTQETQIEKLQAEIDETERALARKQKEFANFAATASAE